MRRHNYDNRLNAVKEGLTQLALAEMNISHNNRFEYSFVSSNIKMKLKIEKKQKHKIIPVKNINFVRFHEILYWPLIFFKARGTASVM